MAKTKFHNYTDELLKPHPLTTALLPVRIGKMSSSPWMPISPSFGGQRHHFGYYHNIAHYLLIVPLVLLFYSGHWI